MRVIHFADNHLGAGSMQREQDILDSFAATIDKIIELKPDLVINAGDLFHLVRPTNRILAFAAEQLYRLGHTAGIPTVIITGNHDAPKQIRMGAAIEIFKDFDNIYPVYNFKYERIRIENVSVSCVPHCLTSEMLKEEQEKITPDPQADYNILVLHGIAERMEEFRMAQLAEQELEVSKYCHGFDYVALGHYHNFTRVQAIKEAPVYYSGSTERLSQSEAAHDKGFLEIDFSKSPVEPVFHKVKTRVMIDLPVIDARGKSAQEVENIITAAVREAEPGDKIIRQKIIGIAEETHRTIDFKNLDKLKEESFSIDIRFEKQEKVEDNPLVEINISRLDFAFEQFLESQNTDNLDKKKIAELGVAYLRRAVVDEADNG